MRTDTDLLRDMLQAAAALERHLASVTRVAFLADELRQDAVARHLAILGESAAKVSLDLRLSAPDVNWPTIAALRPLVAPADAPPDWKLVWTTATQRIPRLREPLERALKERTRE